jgi:hypothetical protein
MGFMFGRYAKGMYVDGHEREDVVAYQKEFFENMAKYVYFFISNGRYIFFKFNILLKYNYIL